jgi:hypothetical protein
MVFRVNGSRSHRKIIGEPFCSAITFDLNYSINPLSR